MCGRYTLRRPGLLKKFIFESDFDEFAETRIQPRFNIAPSQPITVVRVDKDNRPKPGEVLWGLIPSWQKSLPKQRPINARAETVATGGMFRGAFARRRCLIPADGFYEWRTDDDGKKQPYFIHFTDNRIFSFAGLWERWSDPTVNPDNQGRTPIIDTAALITTTPNELMSKVHNRMPVLLDEIASKTWLDPHSSTDDLTALLRPRPDDDQMSLHPVSTAVNRPSNDTPENVLEVP